MTGDPTPQTVPLALLSRALDEIYALRQLVAYEADIRVADLGYATYPKSRRKVALARIEALRQAARGQAQEAVAGTSYLSLRHAMREAGASAVLTWHAWQRERLCGRRLIANVGPCVLPLAHAEPCETTVG